VQLSPQSCQRWRRAPTTRPRHLLSQANSTAIADSPAANPASSADADSIRRAVEDHLRNDREINLSAMEMTVDSVTGNGDQARATATFRAKQGHAAMPMVYALQRQSGGWIVSSDQPADRQFLDPPMDQTQAGTSAGQGSSGSGPPDVRQFLQNPPENNPSWEKH